MTDDSAMTKVTEPWRDWEPTRDFAAPVYGRQRVVVRLRSGEVMRPAMAKSRTWGRFYYAPEQEIVAWYPVLPPPPASEGE